MARYREFSVKEMDPDVRKDTIKFSLAEQEFTCRSVLPGWLLLKFVAMSADDARGADAKALFAFFEDVLEPESYSRFVELVSGDDYLIEMETLADISSWLVKEYTARPTQPPESSSNGAGTTGTTSVESVVSED